jgi:hypothetical protein
MTGFMRVIFAVAVLVYGAPAWGTTYYVSSSLGNDGNNGTTVGTPWRTLGQVNAQTFLPGDSVLLRRGDVWNESLVPPSSGTSGNPIAFDAYGTGAGAEFDGVLRGACVGVGAGDWECVEGAADAGDGNLYGDQLLFVWVGLGTEGSAVVTNLTAQWDFYLSGTYVYVYSVGNPATYYNAPIVPMGLSNVPVININGQSGLTLSAHSGELVRSVWGVCTRGERSSGVCEYGKRIR